MTALDDAIGNILAAVADPIGQLGIFDSVRWHESKSSPGNGLTADLWGDRMAPLASASGLGVAAMVLTVNCRIYTPMLQEPADAIDPAVFRAAAAVIGCFIGGFQLAGLIRNVDVFGAAGVSLAGAPGYVGIGETKYRVMTVTIPLIVNDIWMEVA